ncbi:TPA: hypothetical protein ACLBDT_002191, partial [Neisseria meningitidis]
PDVIVVEDNCPLFGIFLKSGLCPEYCSYKSNISLRLTLEYIGIPFLLADEFGLIVLKPICKLRPLQNSPKSPKFPPRHLGDFS